MCARLGHGPVEVLLAPGEAVPQVASGPAEVVRGRALTVNRGASSCPTARALLREYGKSLARVRARFRDNVPEVLHELDPYRLAPGDVLSLGVSPTHCSTPYERGLPMSSRQASRPPCWKVVIT